MSKDENALVPGLTHLPAAIERRTRIANRLLGELAQQDTEAFFRLHSDLFLLAVTKYYPLCSTSTIFTA